MRVRPGCLSVSARTPGARRGRCTLQPGTQQKNKTLRHQDTREASKRFTTALNTSRCITFTKALKKRVRETWQHKRCVQHDQQPLQTRDDVNSPSPDASSQTQDLTFPCKTTRCSRLTSFAKLLAMDVDLLLCDPSAVVDEAHFFCCFSGGGASTLSLQNA